MSSQSSPDKPPILDALIIGLGFSGTYLLHKLLKLNYKVLALDPNDQLGGVWNHNVYPGARVDISVPSYQLNIPELHNHGPWEWSEKYPSGKELREYFRWVQDRLKLDKACEFGVWVERAVWQDRATFWEVVAKDGRKWRANWLLPCLGYAAAPYVPSWKGLDSFQGTVVHSARWPKEGVELEGKHVGVVGTGASGVQIIQTIAPNVKELVGLTTFVTLSRLTNADGIPANTGHSTPNATAELVARRTDKDIFG
jgi:cation diffusion facilitator CzcD-associated flavoprotein CzcO